MKSTWRYIRLIAVLVTTILFVLTFVLWRSPQKPEESIDGGVKPMVEQRRTLPLPKQYHRNPKHLLDQLKLQDLATFDFKSCNMSNCFDYSRCQRPGPMRVGIIPSKSTATTTATNVTLGESNLIHEKMLEIIRNSKHYVPEPDKACLFILEDDTLDRDPLSQSFRSDLTDIFSADSNYGMNHVVFNLYSGTWPSYKENDFSGLQLGAAIVAKASNDVANHRHTFDISLPLFSYLHPDRDSDLEKLDVPDSQDRNLFLTFKGKRYVYGSGSETRNSIYHIDNHRDVLMLTTCRHGKKWRESSDSRCAEDDSRYDDFDYVELMRSSKFCLVPRGRRLGSFRFLEALSFGCIPVILSDGWVMPFDEIIDWSQASLQFDENQLLILGDLLRDFTNAEIDAMREKGLSLYRQYFATKERITLTTLSIIESRVKAAISGTS